jgi:hypothetical protein
VALAGNIYQAILFIAGIEIKFGKIWSVTPVTFVSSWELVINL